MVSASESTPHADALAGSLCKPPVASFVCAGALAAGCSAAPRGQSDPGIVLTELAMPAAAETRNTAAARS